MTSSAGNLTQVGLDLVYDVTGARSQFVVEGVVPGGPLAEAAGARVDRGDQLVAVGKVSVEGKTMEELRASLVTEGAGARLQLTLLKPPLATRMSTAELTSNAPLTWFSGTGIPGGCS